MSREPERKKRNKSELHNTKLIFLRARTHNIGVYTRRWYGFDKKKSIFFALYNLRSVYLRATNSSTVKNTFQFEEFSIYFAASSSSSFSSLLSCRFILSWQRRWAKIRLSVSTQFRLTHSPARVLSEKRLYFYACTHKIKVKILYTKNRRKIPLIRALRYYFVR